MDRVPRRTVRRALAALASLVFGCATPPPVKTEIAAPARQFRVQQLHLPSGMQLLVEDSDEEHTVASVLVFGAGLARACQTTSLVGVQGRSSVVHAPALFRDAERTDPGP